MTAAGTEEHPEVAEISAFAEDLLPPERTAEISGHLARCPLCADVRDSLADIRDVLGTLPAPPRMPEDVARRIDAALAAEALARATAPETGPSDGSAHGDSASTPPGAVSPAPEAGDLSHTVARDNGAAVASHVSRETSPTTDRPSGRAAGSTGPGRNARGARRRWRVLTALAGVAVIGLGGLLAHTLTSQAPGTPQAHPLTSSVATFSGEKLPDKVHQLLGNVQQARPNAVPGAENSPFTTQAPAVPACVLQATGHPGTVPVAAARGSYDGRTSYLVLLPHPSAPSKQVDAYVVDSACAAPGATAGTPGTVLTHQTYPRG